LLLLFFHARAYVKSSAVCFFQHEKRKYKKRTKSPNWQHTMITVVKTLNYNTNATRNNLPVNSWHIGVPAKLASA
jgi:hypothetical protein